MWPATLESCLVYSNADENCSQLLLAALLSVPLHLQTPAYHCMCTAWLSQPEDLMSSTELAGWVPYSDPSTDHSLIFVSYLTVILLPVQDFNASTLTILTEANSTYPHGYCSSQ